MKNTQDKIQKYLHNSSSLSDTKQQILNRISHIKQKNDLIQKQFKSAQSVDERFLQQLLAKQHKDIKFILSQLKLFEEVLRKISNQIYVRSDMVGQLIVGVINKEIRRFRQMMPHQIIEKIIMKNSKIGASGIKKSKLSAASSEKVQDKQVHKQKQKQGEGQLLHSVGVQSIVNRVNGNYGEKKQVQVQKQEQKQVLLRKQEQNQEQNQQDAFYRQIVLQQQQLLVRLQQFIQKTQSQLQDQTQQPHQHEHHQPQHQQQKISRISDGPNWYQLKQRQKYRQIIEKQKQNTKSGKFARYLNNAGKIIAILLFFGIMAVIGIGYGVFQVIYRVFQVVRAVRGEL